MFLGGRNGGLFCRGRDLGQLFGSLHVSLEANAREDDSDHDPLLRVQLVTIGDHGQQDCKQFPGDRDRDQGQGSILFQGIKNEALTQSATDREQGHILQDGRVRLAKLQSHGQFRVGSMPDAKEQEPARHKRRHEQVHKAHHVLSRDLEPMKDLILGRIGHTVQGQVDRHQKQAIERTVDRALLADFVLIDRGQQHESGDAQGDQDHTDVLVQGELATVENNVHQHDGDQLARLCQDHGGVINVLQGSIGEGRGHDGDHGHLGVFGEEGRRGGGREEGFALDKKIEVGDQGGKDGLDEVEEDKELEFEGVLSIGCGRDLLLVIAPGQEACVDATQQEKKRFFQQCIRCEQSERQADNQG